MWLHVAAVLLVGNVHASKQESSLYCASLIDPPVLSFDQELKDTVADAGEEVVLRCSVYGSPQASISWFFNDVMVSSHPAAQLEQAIPVRTSIGSGLVESAFRIPCMSSASVGEYTCVAVSACGHKIASQARVTVASTNRIPPRCGNRTAEAPLITMHSSQRMELIGNVVQLMCRASGNPLPIVIWQKLNEDYGTLESIDNRHDYMPLSNGDLLVLGGESPDVVTESFRCSAHNVHGSDQIDANVLYMEP